MAAVVLMMKDTTIPAYREERFTNEKESLGTRIIFKWKALCFEVYHTGGRLDPGNPETEWLTITVYERQNCVKHTDKEPYQVRVRDHGVDGTLDAGADIKSRQSFNNGAGGFPRYGKVEYLPDLQVTFDALILEVLAYKASVTPRTE